MKKLTKSAERANSNYSIDINKIAPGMNDEDPYNSFYDTASVIFRILSFAMFAFLLIFIISAAFVSAKSFSYENLDYIMRNFALTLEENRDSSRQPIRYSPDSLKGFAIYGNGLAVCRASGLSVFSGTGRQTCSDFIDYSDPVVSASDKYILVYEQGSGMYSLYNAFSVVYSAECEKAIKAADIADNGYYALVTSSDEYSSVVEVYDNDFNLITRFNKNSHVIAVDLSNNEILIVSVSVGNSNTSFDIEILIAEPDNGTVKSTVRQISGFPLGCKITEFGYTVVCRDSVWFYDTNAIKIGTFDFRGSVLNDFRLSGSQALLLFKDKTFEISYSAVCINQYGIVSYKYELSDTVFDIDLYGSSAFILTSGYAVCTNGLHEERFNVDSAHYGCKLLAIDDRSFYYCSDTAAEMFRCGW